MAAWAEPWEPVIRDGKLYGRGGADDGYAAFSSLAAIVALKEQKVPLPRCVILIEASEESGSVHLPAHLRALGTEIGEPSLVVCLDAEAGNYDQVWCTTSLRGNLVGELNIRMLTEGVHSGMGTGISATPFRIAQQLIARLENPVTGDILVDELQVSYSGRSPHSDHCGCESARRCGRQEAPLREGRSAAFERPRRADHQLDVARDSRHYRCGWASCRSPTQATCCFLSSR